jgi:DNA replication protein DnaC
MIEQTKQMMMDLKLFGALRMLDQRLNEATSHGWGHTDFLSSLMTDEKITRNVSNIQRRIKAANFRTDATLERVDVTANRNITKSLIKDLLSLSYLKSPRNILITGPTGVGKTYLATAIGEYACRSGFTCIFIGISVLIEKLLMTRADGTYLKYRERLIKTDLFIIDDVGLKKLPHEIVMDLHDVLEERQGKATMFTTQLPLKNWKEIIDDELALDTIVDKLAHGALEIKLEGHSYRKTRAKKEVLDN